MGVVCTFFFYRLSFLFSFSLGGGRVVRRCWVNFQCRGVLQFGYSRARAYCACSRCEWGCLDIFTLIYPFFPLSPSLWETARYRLKYCLKGPLNPKQPTNQLDIFILICPFSSLSPSLWETARYRLKYCLKGSFSTKQPPTNRKIKQNEKVCHKQNIGSHKQGQGHNQRSKITYK